MWDACTQNTFNIYNLYEEYRTQANEHSVHCMTCTYTLHDVIPWWGKGEPFVNNPLATRMPPCTKTSSMKL